MEHLPGGDRQPYTTVLGMLQNMHKAGLVEADKEGLVHRYRPTVTQQEATGSLLSDFVARFFRGSAEQLVLGLVDARQLAPDDLRAIEAKLQRMTHGESSGEAAAGTATPSRRRKKP
jgi:predicted transcriptional regulator